MLVVGSIGHPVIKDNFIAPVGNAAILLKKFVGAPAFSKCLSETKPVSYTHLTLPTNREV